LTRDWDFMTPGRERILSNNPQALTVVPPLSDLINIRALDGSNLFADRAGANTFVPSNFDATREGIDALKAQVGQFRLALAPTAQLQGGGLANVRAESEVKSFSTTASYQMNPKLLADLDLRFAETTRSALVSGADYGNFRGAILPAGAATNLFGKDLVVTMPVGAGDGPLTTNNRLGRAAAGLEMQLPREWAARLEYTWSFSTVTLQRPVLNVDPAAIANGEIDIFHEPLWRNGVPTVSTLKTTAVRTEINEAAVRLGGTAFRLPAGNAQLTLLVEQRREQLAKGSAREILIPPQGDPVFQGVLPAQKEQVDSAYAELRLPLITAREGQRANVLESQVSVRGDRYQADTALYQGGNEADALAFSSSRFSAASWMASVKFQPLDSLFFRGHCGTGFLPPAVSDLTLPSVQVLQSPGIADPKRGGEPIGAVTLLGGGNPALQPERSRSCGAGVVLGTSGVDGLRFSADYTQIAKSHVIYSPSSWLFDDPTAFFERVPARVTRAARAPNDPYEVGPITRIDASSLNLSRNDVKAWDLALGYTSTPHSFGTLRASTWVTIQPKFVSQLTNDSPAINDAGVGALAPPRFRMSASLTLERGPWLLGWTGRYIPRYVVSRDPMTLLNQGSRYVADQQYHDLYASYALPLRTAADSALHLQLGARNVFQHDPPFDAASLGYYSRYGELELPSYYLLMRAEF
jgi:hypothetical protein